MKKLFFLLLPLMLSGKLIAQENELSPEAFELKLNSIQPQLLDVRTAEEFQNGYIKNALQADWTNKAEFETRVKYLDKDKPLLVYCASGIRSAQAMKWLQQNGFKNVENLNGGIRAWKAAGKPMEAVAETHQMTFNEYNTITSSGKVVLIDFGAEWCPPCKKMEPVLQQLQTELKAQFKLVKVDAGIHTDIMKDLYVETIPSFIIYKNGKEVTRIEGVVSLDELKRQLTLY